MLIRMLGVSEAAEAEGEWPTNYMNVADELELDEGISDVEANNEASRADMALALYNTPFCEVRG